MVQVKKKSENEVVVVGSETISVKLKQGGEYGVWGIEIMHSKQLAEGDNASDVIDEITTMISEKIQAYTSTAATTVNHTPEPDWSKPEVDSSNVDATTTEDDGTEVTEEMIREMDKAELLAFIKDNEIPVNPKEHKKIADLVEAVVAVCFPPEEGSSEDAQNGYENAVTEEQIREMSMEELVEFIKENEIDVPYQKTKKLSILVEMVIEACFPEEPVDETVAEGTGEEGNLTPDAVREMDKDELLALVKQEKLKFDLKKFKKIADLAEAVIAELFEVKEGEDEASPFDDTEFND